MISAPVTWWLEFPEQWDPTSPWHDRRVRLAATLAIDKQAINEVERLGFGRPTGSIIPRTLEFALPLEPFPYDPAQARRLLAEAGYPNGFDAGDLTPLPPFLTMGEAVGIISVPSASARSMRTMERAAFLAAWREKKLQGAHSERLRGVRQRRHPHRDLCAQHGRLRLWRLSRPR